MPEWMDGWMGGWRVCYSHNKSQISENILKEDRMHMHTYSKE
jgi:hypothetical protein